MAEPERVQLWLLRLGVFALCFGLLSCLFAPFVVPIRALFEPIGTDVSNSAIKDSAILPVLLWCYGCVITVSRQPAELHRRFWWSLGCILLLLHIAVAFHLGHGWSHQAAWEHTRQVGGYGDGIFVNYAFALVWSVDVVWMWVSCRSYRKRPQWLKWTVFLFLAFVVFNAAIVFGGWIARVVFGVGVLFPVREVMSYLRREREIAP